MSCRSRDLASPCVILIGASAMILGGSARAAAAANGACPTSETIWAAMALLVPQGALEALPRSAEVEVSDLGDTYRVRLVAGGVERVRVYRDVGRDCEQRARFAAVFIVLTLMPPELLIDTAPKPPPPAAAPPEPSEPPHPTARSAPVVAPPEPIEPRWRRFRLEVGALWDHAPALRSAPTIDSVGGSCASRSTSARVFDGPSVRSSWEARRASPPRSSAPKGSARPFPSRGHAWISASAPA
jgi:hypothetical protein